MAKDESATKARKGGGGAAAEAPAQDGWQKVQTSRPFYFAETCKATPLQGYLLNVEDMPPSDLGPWAAYSIKTTADCLAVPQGEDDSDEPVTIPAGTEVMVKATKQLRQSLSRYLSAHSIMEVRIQPLGLEKLSGGRTMWTYDVTMNPKSATPRPALYPFVAPVRRPRVDDDLPF
jgi:hypothetical protein